MAVSTPTPTEPTPQPKIAQESRIDWQSYQRRLMKDQRYREAWREEQRLQLTQRRENYIKLLGFTSEQADAAIDLAIDRQLAMFDRSQVNPNSEDFARQQREHYEADERAYKAKMLELLGQEKTERLQIYMESRQSRMQVDRFRGSLTGADALREDQVEPLIAAIHAEQSQKQQQLDEYRETQGSERTSEASLRKYAEQESALMKAAHSRIHSSASGILSGSQLDKLDAMLKRDLERQETQQRMARIRSKIDPPTDPKGGSN